MPTPYLKLEPDELRRMARQHDARAAKIRQWGEIPDAWLGNFQPSYGAIADPVRSALVDYYRKRHDKAERRAAHHERTRDALLAAADKIEDADRSGGGLVDRAGDAVDDGLSITRPPGGLPPSLPGIPPSSGPADPHYSEVPGAPPVPRHDAAPVVSAGPVIAGPTPQRPIPSGAAVSSAPYPTPALRGPVLPGGVPGEPRPDDVVITAPTGERPPMYGPLGVDVSAPDERAGEVGILPGLPESLPPESAAALSVAPVAPAIPAPLAPGPFVAAAHAAVNGGTRPPLVVGDRPDDDLALARGLLGSVLAAAGSASGLDWAVAVMRVPAGPLVLLTSTEGRGWVPPGLFLPAEVVLPWKWDGVFGPATRKALSALEGTSDPARILAEFCLAIPRRMRVRITALASSAPISEHLRAAVGDNVAVAGTVSAADSVIDLTAPGAGLADRLALAGSDELLRQAATVPEEQIRATCLGLARAATARLRSAGHGVDPAAARAEIRQRILRALSSGEAVPGGWWDELHGARAAAGWSDPQRDVSRIRIGAVRRAFADAGEPDGAVFERRIEEILRLISLRVADRRTLRDVLYAYGQVVEHPVLAATVSAVVPPPAGLTAAPPVAELSRDTPRSAGPAGGASPSAAPLSYVPAVLPRPSPKP